MSTTKCLQWGTFQADYKFSWRVFWGGINSSPRRREARGVGEREGGQGVPEQPETPQAAAVGPQPARCAAVVPAVPLPGLRRGGE